MTDQVMTHLHLTFEPDAARAEQQRLALLYNVGERQMLRSYWLARRQPGDPGANLLCLLERRLDSLITRCGFAPDIFAARQVVTRHHVLVDGRLVGGAYRRLRPGQKIVIHPRKRQPLEVLRYSRPAVTPPDYLDVNYDTLTAVLLRLPRRDEIPVMVDEALVARYYGAVL